MTTFHAPAHRRALFALGIALVFGTPQATAADSSPLKVDVATLSQRGWATSDDGRVEVLVEMDAPSAAAAFSNSMAGKQVHDPAARHAAAVATQNSLLTISVQQDLVGTALAQLGAREIYRVGRALNGIAVAIDPRQLTALSKLQGVKRVLPIPAEVVNAAPGGVEFLQAANVWGNTLGLPSGATGNGVRIGIIDSGIDYLHADFGGSGALTDYQANNTTTSSAFFPSAKVVGGTDFAGDAYTGSNAPTPDPNPMDCNGHGTHVAGIAAGFGVTSGGATYAGPYDTSTPFGSLSIAPGVAPQALLYAIRVFGCSGTTGLTVQGIDWALDPNGDSDLSDHLDIINLSLGSQFGDSENATSAAAENAASIGVIVVAGAGDDGDTYFVSSSPGASSRTISVAAVDDSGAAGGFVQANSPALVAGNYAAAMAAFSPAPPAPSGQTGSVAAVIAGAGTPSQGCSALANAAAIAGNIALIDEGTCGFITKVANAQAAGAIGAIVVSSTAGSAALTTMTGSGQTITIPSFYVSQADGTKLRSGGVNATLQAASNNDTLASFSSRGPRAHVDAHLKPDIAAPGVSVVSAQTGTTCTASGCITPNASGFLPNSPALTLSGTSMAGAYVTGTMALLRQLHVDWSVEQLKAALMNGALHDVTVGANGTGAQYGAGRVGAGRVDPSNSAAASIVAFNDDNSGDVSVSFDTNEVVGTATEVKNVRVVNTGSAAATYDLSITTTVDAPGVSFALPSGSSVTIPAASSTALPVQLAATASLMTHSKDPTVSPTQAPPPPLGSLGNLARQWLTEKTAYLVFSQGGVTKLRVPLYAAIRAASTMSAPSTIATGGAPTGSTTIPLSGTDVCTGTLAAGPVCIGTFPNDEQSLVTPFELQVVHSRDPSIPAYRNIQYAGVAYNAATNQLLFAISTWGDWASPTDVAFNITVKNGANLRVLYNSDSGTSARNLFGTAGATSQDAFFSFEFNPMTSGVSTGTFVNAKSAGVVDSVEFKNNVMFLAATPAQLGLLSGTTAFTYSISTCSGLIVICSIFDGVGDNVPGPFAFNYLAQGLNFAGTTLAPDLNGATLPVTWNTANFAANGSLGALLLHHHNAKGRRAQVVALQGTSSTDLGITQSVSPTSPALGGNVTLTLIVTNNGPTAATGIVVEDLLPSGLTYVSDDGGGAYSAGNGQWTVGSLAVNASATLHIVATVAATENICNTAQITAVSPLDTNPANDQATECVSAPRTTDLALTMQVSSPTVPAGGTVTYTLTATNNGPDTAYSLNLQNAFPSFPSLHATSFTASEGTYDAATGVWAIGSLASGAIVSLAIVVDVPQVAGALTNQGSVSAVTTDPVSTNNNASATTTIIAPTITLAPTTLPSGTFSQTYTTTTIGASGGTSPYTFTAGAGFPPGLTLASDGQLSGTPTGAGSFTFTVTATDANAFTGAQVYTVTIAQATQTITFGAQAAQSFVANGTFVLSPVASASSGLVIAYSSQTTAVCTISGTTVSIVSAGTCGILASQPGDANYVAAIPIPQNIAIGLASQTITFPAQAAQTFSTGATFAINPPATASSGLPVAYASQTTTVCTISGSTVTILGGGTCTIAASQPGNGNYAAATPVLQNITINRDSTTITLSANANPGLAGATLTFTAIVNGDPPTGSVTFSSNATTICNAVLLTSQIATCSQVFAVPGSFTITADYSGDTNNAPSTASITLVIDDRPVPASVLDGRLLWLLGLLIGTSALLHSRRRYTAQR